MRIPKYRLQPPDRAFVEYRGERTYLGKHNSPQSLKLYAAFVEKLAEDGEPDKNIHVPTLGILAKKYLKWAEGYYVAEDRDGEGEDAYIALALKPLLKKYGAMRADKFGPLALTDVQSIMAETMTRTTVNVRISKIKRFFRWCTQNELIPPSVYHGLLSVEGLKIGRSKAKPERVVKPVPREHVDAVLPFLNRQIAAMVQVQAAAGMRPGDVCRMRPCDIDRSHKTWIYRPPKHKTSHLGHTLAKAIPPEAQEILLPFMDRPAESYLFSPMEAKLARLAAGTDRRRIKKTRERYSVSNYHCSIQRAIRRAKKQNIIIPRWHPNQLRHLSATELRTSLGEEAAQVWLGHKKINTTAIYTDKTEGELLAVADKLSSLKRQPRPAQRGKTKPQKSKPKHRGKRKPRRS